jgi:hypothetical protein
LNFDSISSQRTSNNSQNPHGINIPDRSSAKRPNAQLYRSRGWEIHGKAGSAPSPQAHLTNPLGSHFKPKERLAVGGQKKRKKEKKGKPRSTQSGEAESNFNP